MNQQRAAQRTSKFSFSKDMFEHVFHGYVNFTTEIVTMNWDQGIDSFHYGKTY